MNYYEVFLKLVSHGKEIGRTAIHLQTETPFLAGLEAGKILQGTYGNDVVSRILRVSQITEDEFLYQVAA